MFNPITIPYGAKMLYNVAKLKPEYTLDDAELAIGSMCNTVKNTYPGFIAGQVFQFKGFISEEGSVKPDESKVEDHIAIITYWKSFEEHEESHSNSLFKEHFCKLLEMCEDTYEIGYEMLWQGEPE